jgi:competence ComEA-like helix-hairpin-helix protein
MDDPLRCDAHAHRLARGADRWAVLVGVTLMVATATTWWGRPLERRRLDPRPTGYRLPINTASAGDLQALPGLGPALARQVVDHRRQAGPFRDADDLQAVQGIGPKTARRLEPWITFDLPPTPRPIVYPSPSATPSATSASPLNRPTPATPPPPPAPRP